MLDLNQMERGAKFSELKKSVIIFICLENLSHWAEGRVRQLEKLLEEYRKNS